MSSGSTNPSSSSHHHAEKEKKHRSLRVVPKASSASSSSNAPSSSSVIAPLPRAALQGRGQHPAADEEANPSSSSSSKLSSTQDSGQGPSTDSTPSPTSTSTSTNPNTTSPNTTKSKEHKRIAELEEDLAHLTTHLTTELSTLSHSLTNERDSSAFWQQKHSSLNQTFLKTDTSLRLLRQEIQTLQSQLLATQSSEQELKNRIGALVSERDAFREAYSEKEGEVRRLMGQVRGLKSWVSSSSKVDEQVADEAVGEKMQRLGNGLQNWVITNFRRVKIDTEKVNDETLDLLMQLVPTYNTLATTSKIHLVQSLVSRIIVEHIFLAYFVGLSQERSEELENVEKHLSSYGNLDSMNQWRSATLAILRKDASQTLASETSQIVESLVHQINSIMTSISDIQPSEARDQSLRALINSSIDLSRLLRVQKAVFSILMPCIEAHQQTMFDPDCMEDIGGEDEDTLNQREIRCVTFPGIVKSGDENGERNHLRNVVAKIRVLCAPD